MATAMQKIEAAVGTGVHTGDMVWWALRESEIDAVAFRNAWVAAGLAPDVLPDVMAPATLLKKVATEAVRGATPPAGMAADTELLCRPVGRKGGLAVFELTWEEHDPDGGRNKHTHVATISVNVDTGLFATDAPAGDPLTTGIAQAYAARHGRYFSWDVASSILGLIEQLGGVSLRGGGGIYWLSFVHATTVRAIKGVVDALGSSRFDVLPIHDSQEGNRALAAAARDSLDAKVTALKAEMDAWVANGKARAGTLEHRLVEYDALKARAAEYVNALGATVDDLLLRVEDIRDTARKMLDDKEDEKKDATPAPASVA